MNHEELEWFNLEYSREDIENLANLLLNASLDERPGFTDYNTYIDIIDISELDLDALAGKLMGLTDPIGQLKEWLEDILSSIGDWIVNSLSGVIEGVKGFFETLINTAKAGLESLIKGVGDVVSGLSDFVSEQFSKVVDFFNTLFDMLEQSFDILYDFITTLINDALASLGSVLDTIIENIRNIGDTVRNIVSSIIDAISGAINEVANTLSGLINSISKTVSDFWKWVENTLSTLSSALQNIGSQILSGIQKFGDMVREGISNLSSLLGSIASTIVSTVSEGLETVSGFIKSVVDGVLDAIGEIGGKLASIGEYVKEGFESLASEFRKIVIEPVLNAIKVAEGFIASIPDIIKNIENTVNALVEGIKEFIARLPEEISKTLSIIGEIKKVAGEVVETIINLPKKLPEAITNISTLVWENIVEPALTTIYDKIVKPFTSIVDNIIENVTKGFDLIARNFTGFVNAIMNFPTWFSDFITKPLETIKTVIENLVNFIRSFVDIILHPDKLVDILGKFVTDTVNKLKTIVWEGFKTVTTWIWDKVISLISLFKSLIEKGFEKILEISKDLAESVLKPLGAIISTIIESIFGFITKKASPSIVDTISNTIIRTLPVAFGGVEAIMKTFTEISPDEVIKEPVRVLYKILTYIVPLSVAYALVRRTIPLVTALFPDITVRLNIPGLSADARKRLKDFFEEVGKTLDSLLPDVARYLVVGHMIWWAEPTRAITRAWLSEALTIELPPMETTLESVRRHLVTPLVKDYYKMFVNQLRMGGIYKGFIEALFPLPDKLIEDFTGLGANFKEDLFSVLIKDRFGRERKVPLSLIARLPNPSELARMMIRDIILDPDYFKVVMGMHGFHPDVAFMYYLLHFKYPSPEKLWEFVARGLSGALWYVRTSKDEAEARDLIQKFNLKEDEFMPTSPVELNYKYQALFNAFAKYMKWHDYLPFSWLSPDDIGFNKPFTSDNMIIRDVVVDIPTKIDQRWMVKWGIYQELHDLLNVKGTLPEKPIIEIIRKYIEKAEGRGVATNIEFDLRLFCRTLQATGLHPAYVPIVAIAEAINALTDERTLLRTGFINLYKEGFFTYKDLEELLKGFFYVKFIVERLTVEEGVENMKWKKHDVYFPVMFLPAERKLLELRAVFDRALDVLRDYMKMLGTAVRSLIYEPSEALSKLESFVKEKINKWFKDEVKQITGIERELTLDEKWVSLYTQYFKELRDIETIIRARYYSRYLVYAITRRFERGYITRDEAVELISSIRETLRESPLFEELFTSVADKILEGYIRDLKAQSIINQAKRRKISIRDAIDRLANLGLPEDVAKALVEAKVIPYSISLTTLATLEEIVPEAWKYAIDSLGLFGLRKDEFEYWVKYMIRKPFKDELTLVRTRIYNALAEGIEPSNLVSILKDYMIRPSIKVKEGEYELKAEVEIDYGDVARKLKEFYDSNKEVFEAYGISVEEWILFNLISALERKRESIREYIPTPTMLATLMEYIRVPEELVDKALKLKNVPGEWYDIWKKYITIRPLANDIRALLTPYRRAKVLGILPKELEEKVKKYLELIGFTEREFKVVDLRVELEQLIESVREYVPTPSMLATLSEYIVIPEELVDKALEFKRVPDEWKPLWKQYISVRPIADDIKALVSDYLRAKVLHAIPEDIERKVLEYAKLVGYTDRELEVLGLRETIRELIERARGYIPTPSMLASISEVIPEARRLLDKVLERRRVPSEWWDIWSKYIDLKPIIDDVKKLLSRAERLYTRFIISLDDFKKVLGILTLIGWEEREIGLLLASAELERQYYAYDMIIGSPKELVVMAEYSPRAREFALGQAEKMIDALPVDPNTKEFLKEMWREYIRIKPIYDEVRRYITELLSDYANGLMTLEQLKTELNELKKWGLDDYEVNFYIWLAEKRRTRYVARQMMSTGGGFP